MCTCAFKIWLLAKNSKRHRILQEAQSKQLQHLLSVSKLSLLHTFFLFKSFKGKLQLKQTRKSPQPLLPCLKPKSVCSVSKKYTHTHLCIYSLPAYSCTSINCSSISEKNANDVCLVCPSRQMKRSFSPHSWCVRVGIVLDQVDDDVHMTHKWSHMQRG